MTFDIKKFASQMAQLNGVEVYTYNDDNDFVKVEVVNEDDKKEEAENEEKNKQEWGCL